MIHKQTASLLAVSCLMMLSAAGAFALSPGDTIVGNVFVTGFDGWTDTCVPYVNPSTGTPEGAPNWGVLLVEEKALSESNDVIVGPATSSWPLGKYDTQNMVKMNSTTPSDYTITAKFGSWDDDGYGIVWGYQDEGNYFRIGFRQQDTDSYGFPRGISIQKVVTSNITQLGQNTAIRTLLPDDGSFFYDVSVTVSGNTYSVKANPGGGAMEEWLSGSDTDLPDMAAGHYGVHSWAQKQDSTSETGPDKQRGTMVKSISVASATLNETTTFADVIPINWRRLQMTNALGNQGGGGEDAGNFRQDFRDGTIQDDTNSYEWATTNAPNVDFIGTGVVVDESGNAGWTNYEMTVRVACLDDEGPGVLLRVQDDDTFYRVNFARQTIGTGVTRAPRGMSIQKCKDGVWSELFRDDQDNPLFVYTDRTADYDEIPFDLKVRVIDNTIRVQVIDDPLGTPVKINYPLVVDNDSPILSGSVGFTNWGAGDLNNGLVFSAYGGQEGHPLLVCIPEPSTLVLLGFLALSCLGVRHRR